MCADTNDDYIDITFITVNDYEDVHIKNLKNESQMAFFNTHDFIYKNLASYKFDWYEVWKQFQMDYNRQKITIDNKHIKDLNEIINYFLRYEKYHYSIMKDSNAELWLVFMMLCNQSSYYLPYVYMRSQYDDPINNLCVLDSKSDRVISFTVNTYTKKLSIIYTTTFNIINIKNEVIDSKINIQMVLNTNLIITDKSVHTFEKDVFEKTSLITWTIVK